MAAREEGSVLYSNSSGRLTLEHVAEDRYVLHVWLYAIERIDRADGMEMIAAMEAFYKLNRDKRFAHLIDIRTTYIPSPDLILATINLMREHHVYFQQQLLFSAVVMQEHADTLKTYMRGWKPTKPVHYLRTTDEIYALFN